MLRHNSKARHRRHDASKREGKSKQDSGGRHLRIRSRTRSGSGRGTRIVVATTLTILLHRAMVIGASAKSASPSKQRISHAEEEKRLTRHCCSTFRNYTRRTARASQPRHPRRKWRCYTRRRSGRRNEDSCPPGPSCTRGFREFRCSRRSCRSPPGSRAWCSTVGRCRNCCPCCARLAMLVRRRNGGRL